MTSNRPDKTIELAAFLAAVAVVALFARAILGMTGNDPTWLVFGCIVLGFLAAFATFLFTRLRSQLRKSQDRESDRLRGHGPTRGGDPEAS